VSPSCHLAGRGGWSCLLDHLILWPLALVEGTCCS
jgi:hypothetical protein